MFLEGRRKDSEEAKLQPEEEDNQLEDEYLEHREESPVTLTNKSSMANKVTPAEEEITKEVEVEEEA